TTPPKTRTHTGRDVSNQKKKIQRNDSYTDPMTKSHLEEER
ncbi:16431_t:CDS:1, partial [Gigaspora margarita]